MSDAHQFHPTLLREYDIRGLVGEVLFEADARALGRAFGSRIVLAGGSGIAVGRDGRHSSRSLEAALVEGLTLCGLDVQCIGTCPTPELYFAVHHLGLDGGIMVTGSHNPPLYNGFKMMLGTASFFGADIQELGARAARGDFVTTSEAKGGETKASGAKGAGAKGGGTKGGAGHEADTRDAYVARLLSGMEFRRPLSVIWDCGNGASGPVVARLTAALAASHGFAHEVLFADIDGDFPNHHPDPTVPANLVDLQAAVRRTGADLGLAFDGDGDRIGVVDETGCILWGDQLLALLAEDVLAALPGASIVADVKASQTLYMRVAALGGVPLMWRSGHSLIRAKMAETGAPLGGEMSGHIFFADRYYGFDDALYAGLRLLEAVAGRAVPLSAWRRQLPQMINTPEIRFQCPDDRKFAAIEEVRQLVTAQLERGAEHRLERGAERGAERAAGLEIIAVDGVRVQSADGWWLLRASNTEDMLTARCEARDAAGMLRVKQDLCAALCAVGLNAPAALADPEC